MATSGEFLNFLNPHGDQIDLIQHHIASPDVQLRLERDDRVHIQKLSDRVYLVEEVDRIKTVAMHTKDLIDQFLKPNSQTPIARKVRERSAQLYRKKFKRLPRSDLDFSLLMTSNTHFVSGDSTNRCITSNLTLTYKTSFPDDMTKLLLTSPTTATDLNHMKCIVLTGTARVASNVVYAEYPTLEIEKNVTLCSETNSCQSVLTPMKPCLTPEFLHFENGRVSVFSKARILVSCRKSSENKVNSSIGLSFKPQPLCSY